jgi:hypothetical protein
MKTKFSFSFYDLTSLGWTVPDQNEVTVAHTVVYMQIGVTESMDKFAYPN